MKTPHRASSLCCHETNDGRIAKLTHTPSMKAGQLSRHSCNQIPRGRYQHAKVQAGPEHQTRQPAGEGRQRGRRKEPQQRRTDNKRSNRAHTSTTRNATNTRRTTRRTNRSTNNTIPRAPEGNSCKEPQDHQTDRGQHRQYLCRASCA